ncbi:hypothetical protein STEG23_028001 [Scotinomys teguina]
MQDEVLLRAWGIGEQTWGDVVRDVGISTTSLTVIDGCTGPPVCREKMEEDASSRELNVSKSMQLIHRKEHARVCAKKGVQGPVCYVRDLQRCSQALFLRRAVVFFALTQEVRIPADVLILKFLEKDQSHLPCTVVKITRVTDLNEVYTARGPTTDS